MSDDIETLCPNVPREWYDDMRTAWEREKLRADSLERKLREAMHRIRYAAEKDARVERHPEEGRDGKA